MEKVGFQKSFEESRKEVQARVGGGVKSSSWVDLLQSRNSMSAPASSASQLPSTPWPPARDPASLSPLAHPPEWLPCSPMQPTAEDTESLRTGQPKVWQKPPVSEHHSCHCSSGRGRPRNMSGKTDSGDRSAGYLVDQHQQELLVDGVAWQLRGIEWEELRGNIWQK